MAPTLELAYFSDRDTRYHRVGTMGRVLPTLKKQEDEIDSLKGKLKEIDDAKPKIVARGKAVQRIPFHDRFSRQLIFAGDFVKMTFINDPKGNYAKSVAQGVRIKIKFLDPAGSILLDNMDGRWDSTDQPGTRDPENQGTICSQ